MSAYEEFMALFEKHKDDMDEGIRSDMIGLINHMGDDEDYDREINEQAEYGTWNKTSSGVR